MLKRSLFTLSLASLFALAATGCTASADVSAKVSIGHGGRSYAVPDQSGPGDLEFDWTVHGTTDGGACDDLGAIYLDVQIDGPVSAEYGFDCDAFSGVFQDLPIGTYTATLTMVDENFNPVEDSITSPALQVKPGTTQGDVLDF